jgi:Flp pilus assembly protein protease CpaA
MWISQHYPHCDLRGGRRYRATYARADPEQLVAAGCGALILRAALGLVPLWHGVRGGRRPGVGFPLFALRAFGGGDMKFMVACAAFVGLPLLGLSALFAAPFGGLLPSG